MYTLSCLNLAYEFLNREWMFLIYGDQKKTWYTSLKKWIDQWYLSITNAMNLMTDYQFIFKKNYQFLIVIIIMSLVAFFTVYKGMKKFKLLEVKNYFLDLQLWRTENSNKISSAFHENYNESLQLTEDSTSSSGSSQTVIIQPTFQPSEISETVEAKEGLLIERLYRFMFSRTQSRAESGNSEANESEAHSGSTRVKGELIRRMQKIFQKKCEEVDISKPLVKCSSSLHAVTSEDSLNTELLTENKKSQIKETEKGGMRVTNKTNSNLTFSVHDSSSNFDIDDLNSSVYEDTISNYQSSTNEFPSHDTPALHKNSSCVSGHFLEHLPDLDLSPITNIFPKNRNHDQSLKTELLVNDKEVQGPKSKHTRQGSRDGRYFSRPLSCSPRGLKMSSKKFLTCVDCKTNFFDEETLPSEIPSLDCPLKSNDIYEEDASFSRKNALDIAASKIPIRLKKYQMSFSANDELNESSRKTGIVRKDHKKDFFGSKESEQSLEKFLELEIATGCHNTNDF